MEEALVVGERTSPDARALFAVRQREVAAAEWALRGAQSRLGRVQEAIAADEAALAEAVARRNALSKALQASPLTQLAWTRVSTVEKSETECSQRVAVLGCHSDELHEQGTQLVQDIAHTAQAAARLEERAASAKARAAAALRRSQAVQHAARLAAAGISARAAQLDAAKAAARSRLEAARQRQAQADATAVTVGDPPALRAAQARLEALRLSRAARHAELEAARRESGGEGDEQLERLESKVGPALRERLASEPPEEWARVAGEWLRERASKEAAGEEQARQREVEALVRGVQELVARKKALETAGRG